MHRFSFFAAAFLWASLALANPPGAARAPTTRTVQDGPIADSPPPPPRSDLGAMVEPTITLTASAPHFAGRASLRVGSDADVGGWSSNPAASITTPMPNQGASFFARAGKNLTWPSYPLDKGLPPEIQKDVQTALGNELDPGKLDALATSLTTKYGQKYPLAVSALRSMAAALRASPNAKRVRYSTKLVRVDFPTPAKARSSVVTCHFVHTGGAVDLVVGGTSSVVIPNRSAKWVEADQDSQNPASKLLVISPASSDQAWALDRCLVTGYASASSAAPLNPGSAASLTQATARSTSGSQPPSPAAAPLGESGMASAVSLSPRTPTIANRAFLSAAWRVTNDGTLSASADATNNELRVTAAPGDRGTLFFELSVDVYQKPQSKEVVACEIANAGSQPVNIAGQSVPQNASRWVELTLAPVTTATWTTAKFTATSFSSLATRGCRIGEKSASPASPAARAIRR